MTNAIALLRAVRARLDRPSLLGAFFLESEGMREVDANYCARLLGFQDREDWRAWEKNPRRAHADITALLNATIARLDEAIEKQEAPNA